MEISHRKQLLLLIFFLRHNHKNYDPLKFDQLITLFFCYLLQKSQLKFLKMRKKFLFQTKSWISACCHCMRAHANHLIFSHHAVCIKDVTKNKTDPLKLHFWATGRQKGRKIHFFSFFSRCNTLSLDLKKKPIKLQIFRKKMWAGVQKSWNEMSLNFKNHCKKS